MNEEDFEYPEDAWIDIDQRSDRTKEGIEKARIKFKEQENSIMEKLGKIIIENSSDLNTIRKGLNKKGE